MCCLPFLSLLKILVTDEYRFVLNYALIIIKTVMTYNRKQTKELAQLIKSEQQKLKKIEQELRKQVISFSNNKYLRLLSRAAQEKQNINFLKIQKQLITRNVHKQIIVNLSSRVQLLSTKVGDVFFVDARNYLQLLGKTIGDAVIMNNAKFLIAGVY